MRATLTELLTLEPLEPGVFRNIANVPNANGVAFGGQIVGQAVVAASHGVEDKALHSVHCNFLTGASLTEPIRYVVTTLHAGRSFAARQVIAMQSRGAVFTMTASFHADEAHFEHQRPPSAPAPDPDLLDTVTTHARRMEGALNPIAYRFFTQSRAMEVKPVSTAEWLHPGADSHRQYWLSCEPVGALPGLSRDAGDKAAFAFISDFWLVGVGAMPHAPTPPVIQLMMASLDHSIWFHRSFDPTQWMLVDADSPVAQGGRTLARATVFDRAGTVIASLAQEAVMRPRRQNATQGD
ncbi:acyl-CoA thioesterase [Sphingomonas sp. 37zxx]|uniref:acyl-CoA thioesterase n=1 Tax=Sphingomonas sp. 37zxx TaxID=1550073 RepID=UPI00053BFFE9|nr:acyl-CoA thioesterase domain-containing protein [Sphingomonas sp. 37zxx]